jgi:hypothetical protein
MIEIEVSWFKVFVFFDTAGSQSGISTCKYAVINLRLGDLQ